MSDDRYEVVVSAGTLRPPDGARTTMPHRWTPGGVAVDAEFTGAHLLHLSVAGCVLNDLFREASRLGIAIDGARVRASGSFDPSTWSSTGVSYEVEVASGASVDELDRLISVVDDVAEIPNAIRAGAPVRRVDPLVD